MIKNEITWVIHAKAKGSLKMLAQRCNAVERIFGLILVASEQKNRKDRLVYILKYQKKYFKILREMLSVKIRFTDVYSLILNGYLAKFYDRNVYIAVTPSHT